ncbi:MAG: DUF2628 domain-containing protein [Betaproteobacteria bacterium]|nr:DUF2628 domain-containing protein [Betaproteobacteria bacterium]
MALCIHCGIEVLRGAAFCGACGKPAAQPAAIQPPPVVALAATQTAGATPNRDLTNEVALRTFVGPNYEYYARKWRTGDHLRTIATWNWMAGCFTIFWLAYRKMYLYCTLYVIAANLIYLLQTTTQIGTWFWMAFGLALMVCWGLLGNHLYRNHAQKQVSLVLAHTPPQEALRELEVAGGTSGWAAFGMGLAHMVLAAFISLVQYALISPK